MHKILLITLLIYVSLYAENNNTYTLSLFDKQDGKLDLSEHLSQAYGFMPIPILITEPAVGYGGGLALVYLHDKIGINKSQSGRVIPSSISAVMLAATKNGTKIAGAGHIGYWLEDTLRTATYIGNPDVFINIYSDRNAIEMNLKGLFFYQNAKLRILESNFFIGGSYTYFKSDAKFDFKEIEEDFGGSSTVSALGLIAAYDSRDNSLSPNKGLLVDMKIQMYDKAIGSDYTFQGYKVNALLYNPLNSKINLDFNLIAQKVVGDKKELVPYLIPFISMRGIPVMKYQGENVLSLETQLSYQFNQRWRALVFGGLAKAFGNQIASPTLSFADATSIYSGGLGFRYLIAKKFGLRIGVDVAKSKEDEALYIHFGTAWKGF